MAESLEKGKSKHKSWMERMKSLLGVASFGTLGANYLLAGFACVTFPPYILAGATAGAYMYLMQDSGKKGKEHH